MIYLASNSPRRAELLTQIGVEFEIIQCSIDESPKPDEAPAQYVSRMAYEKAREGSRYVEGLAKRPLPVLAADTIVVAGDEILCKPESEHHAVEMLQKLSATTHRVMTAVALASEGSIDTVIVETEVSFRPITVREMHAYWSSGEPLDKAGGYAIQGLGAVFVSRIAGSYSGVVGLPLQETAKLLEHAGVSCL